MPAVKNPLHILIVEDDKVDVKNIKQEFLNFSPNLKFYVAQDGVDALNQLNGSKSTVKLDPLPQLIIVDIKMPRMDGNELVKKLRSDPFLKNIPVFVLTVAYTSQDKIATAGLQVPHIVKPLQRDDVIHMYMTALKFPEFN